MANKTIAIIGATERIGAMLTKNLAGGKHSLLLFSHNMQKLRAMVKEIKKVNPAADLHSYKCLVDAGWEADIIAFAVPLNDVSDLAERVRQVATQKVVINMSKDSNPMQVEQGEGQDMNDIETLERLLPHSQVVNVYFENESQYRGSADRTPVHMVITGSNIEAVATVEEIFLSSGFDVTTHIASEDAKDHQE